MNKTTDSSSRIIQVKDGIIGPVEPRPVTVQHKKIGDYPGIPAVYLETAKNHSSPVMSNPPICDELIALVQHMYTEEEASLARHIKTLKKLTAAELAKLENRPVEEVRKIMERLANEKHILASFGTGNDKRYGIMPMAPGTFESVQMDRSVGTPNDALADWRKRFAELYEELYSTGYMSELAKNFPAVLRTLPIGRSIESNPSALPSDKLEEVFDRYNNFAVGNCGCRMTMRQVGEDCGRPLEVCTAMGDYVDFIINKGLMRRAEKKEIIEIKKQAEESGLVHWIGNYDELSGKYGNFSCSCCGCCCVAFRQMTEFNLPSTFAPPHFVPDFNLIKCDYCGQCAKRCQLGAITINTTVKSLTHSALRCIGCGQCSLACDKKQAVEMKPVPKFKKPGNSLLLLGIKSLPQFLRMTWSAWKERR